MTKSEYHALRKQALSVLTDARRLVNGLNEAVCELDDRAASESWAIQKAEQLAAEKKATERIDHRHEALEPKGGQ